MSAHPSCIVVACADERDLPAAVAWLRAERQVDVVAVAVDLGRGWDRAAAEGRLRAAGAARVHVLDASEEFAREYVLPSLRGGGADAPGAPSLFGLGRPLVARTLVEVAAIERAGTIAVEPSLEDDVQALNPVVARLILPPVAGGETPQAPRPAALPVGAGGSREGVPGPVVDIMFSDGMPTAVNGVPMRLFEMLDSLSVISGGDGAQVLRAACRALGPDRATGTVHMQFLNGECTSLATQPS